MGTKIVAVRVAAPGTHEQHITDFKSESGNVIPKESLISLIANFGLSYYTLVGGKRAELIVSLSQEGNKYVKTESDDTTANNLLSLPRF